MGDATCTEHSVQNPVLVRSQSWFLSFRQTACGEGLSRFLVRAHSRFTGEIRTPAALEERRGQTGYGARAAVTWLMSLAMACRQSEAKRVKRDKTKF
jgi:hypothetical protein